MKVNYKNTYKDVFCFMNYTNMRNSVYMGFLFICSFYVSYSNFHKNDTMSYLVIIIVTLILASILYVVSLLLGSISMISKKNKTFITEHTITLEDDFLKEDTTYGSSEIKWAGIQGLKKTNNYIYIYISKYMAHVIPIKAFNNDKEMESFLNYCKEHMGK